MTTPEEQTGFTVVEMLIAMALMIAAIGSVFALVNPARGAFQAQPEVADLQQRLRVGVDTLAKDLVMAGAGVSRGIAAGPLFLYFAPMTPYRHGEAGDDARAGVFFRPDTVSVLYVPATHAQASVVRATKPGSEVLVEAHVNCGVAAHDALCGFRKDMRVVIFDSRGAYDGGIVTDVAGNQLRLKHAGSLAGSYDRGDAVVAELTSATYYLKTDVSSGTFQLMHYDGYQTDLPVVDHVVGLEFEYLGAAEPPQLIRDPVSGNVLRTTYGLRPPAPDVDEPFDLWGTGENCVFSMASGVQGPRLPAFAGGGLVRLTSGMLSDGPWCPDAAHARRFDADLLRIRQVHVRLRLQVAAASMRGPAGVLFARGGATSSAERFVPDQEIRLDIAPRNMGR